MYKYLITGGCSFTVADSWVKFLGDHLIRQNPDIVIVNTAYHSQGQEMIQKKVTLAILDAFDKGIKPEEILCAVMWSGNERKAWYVTNPLIIDEILGYMPNFVGGMSSLFLDLYNKTSDNIGHFYTSHGSRFDYDKNGGWYFTVNGSETRAEFIQNHYLFDRHVNGIGKLHISLENIIWLQSFCKTNKVSLVQQFFMDNVINRIVENKDHEILSYLYSQLDYENMIPYGIFDYLHPYIGLPRENALYVGHDARKQATGDSEIFNQDGFHPGIKGFELWWTNVLHPFLLERSLLND